MHHQTETINTPINPAPRFSIAENVALNDFHLSAAMSAAKQIRSQYSKPSKTKLVRECLDQLRAFLASSKGVRP